LCDKRYNEFALDPMSKGDEPGAFGNANLSRMVFAGMPSCLPLLRAMRLA
jgi:hypothetical protein